jgi:hypothetical protein
MAFELRGGGVTLAREGVGVAELADVVAAEGKNDAVVGDGDAVEPPPPHADNDLRRLAVRGCGGLGGGGVTFSSKDVIKFGCWRSVASARPSWPKTFDPHDRSDPCAKSSVSRICYAGSTAEGRKLPRRDVKRREAVARRGGEANVRGAVGGGDEGLKVKRYSQEWDC